MESQPRILRDIANAYGIPRPPSVEYAIRMFLAKMHYHDHQFEEGFKNADIFRIEEAVVDNVDLLFLKYLIQTKIAMNKVMPLKKSDQKSNLIRNNGNKLMEGASVSRPSSYFPIMYRYEVALCFAESSECKAKAYGNISRIYQILKMPKHSLKAADFALEYSSSGDIEFKDNISKRMLVIKTDLALKLQDTSDEAGIITDAERNIHISEFIHLSEEAVVSKKLLKPGDVVAVTKSFVSTNNFVFQRQACRNCGVTVSTTKIPCKYCPYATFCSDECVKLGMEGFHDLECQNLIDNDTDTEDLTLHLALKFACKALALTCGKSLPITSENYTCFDWDKDAGSDDISILKAILKMTKVDLSFVQMAEVAFYLDFLLKSGSKSSQKLGNFLAKYDRGIEIFKEMFLKMYPLLQRNAFFCDYNCTIDGFYGNLTHSCRPNLLIFRDSKHGTNQYVVFQEIKPGEKLTVALAETYSHSWPYNIRHPLLEENFGFDCRCYACQEFLPIEKLDKNVMNELYKDIDMKLEDRNFNDLVKEFMDPGYNYHTSKAIFSHLYRLKLGEIFLDRTFEAVGKIYQEIEQGLK